MKNYRGYRIKDSGEYDGSCYVIGYGICFMVSSPKKAKAIINELNVIMEQAIKEFPRTTKQTKEREYRYEGCI